MEAPKRAGYRSSKQITMARYKSPALKKRLAKCQTQTRWAPYWTVPRTYGKTRRVHPGRHTHVKRSWRRTKTKAQ